MASPLAVTIKHEGRADGAYSIYVQNPKGSQGPYYTGLTFASRRQAERVRRFLAVQTAARE